MKFTELFRAIFTKLVNLPQVLFISVLLFSLLQNSLIAQEDKYTISLKSREFVPKAGIEMETISELSTLITAEQITPPVMVQFMKIPSSRDRELLIESGIKPLKYIGSNAWYASISKSQEINFTNPEVIKRILFLV